jgi:hypothetical protein
MSPIQRYLVNIFRHRNLYSNIGCIGKSLLVKLLREFTEGTLGDLWHQHVIDDVDMPLNFYSRGPTDSEDALDYLILEIVDPGADLVPLIAGLVKRLRGDCCIGVIVQDAQYLIEYIKENGRLVDGDDDIGWYFSNLQSYTGNDESGVDVVLQSLESYNDDRSEDCFLVIELQLFSFTKNSPSSIKNPRGGDVAFFDGAQFSNPNIYRALTQIGYRIGSAESRIRLATALMAEQFHRYDDATKLAVSTVYVYAHIEVGRPLIQANELSVSNLLAEFQTLTAVSPVQNRWGISLAFSMAEYYRSQGDNSKASRLYRQVVQSHPSRSSVLLESKRLQSILKLYLQKHDGISEYPVEEFLTHQRESTEEIIHRMVEVLPEREHWKSFWFAEIADIFDAISSLQEVAELNIVDVSRWATRHEPIRRRFGLIELVQKLAVSNEDLSKAHSRLNLAAQRQRTFISRLMNASAGKYQNSWANIIKSFDGRESLGQETIFILGGGDTANYFAMIVETEGFQHSIRTSEEIYQLIGDLRKGLDQHSPNHNSHRLSVLYTPFEPLNKETIKKISTLGVNVRVLDVHDEILSWRQYGTYTSMSSSP